MGSRWPCRDEQGLFVHHFLPLVVLEDILGDMNGGDIKINVGPSYFLPEGSGGGTEPLTLASAAAAEANASSLAQMKREIAELEAQVYICTLCGISLFSQIQVHGPCMPVLTFPRTLVSCTD